MQVPSTFPLSNTCMSFLKSSPFRVVSKAIMTPFNFSAARLSIQLLRVDRFHLVQCELDLLSREQFAGSAIGRHKLSCEASELLHKKSAEGRHL